MNRRLKSLVWPLAVLVAGAVTSWAADTAVGRFEAYGFYGFARPVADLLLVIGGLWLVIGLIRLLFDKGGRRG